VQDIRKAVGQPGFAIGLYHPVFTQFEASVNNPSLDISPEELSLAEDFMDASMQVYTNEEERFKELKPTLDQLLESEFVCPHQVETGADRNIITNHPDGPVALRGIWELENGSSDPVNQVGYSYQKYWSSTDVSTANLHHSLCLLLAFRGIVFAPLAVAQVFSLHTPGQGCVFLVRYLWGKLRYSR
jgi:hypothetical protein